MRIRHRARPAVVLVALGLLVAACGTTVDGAEEALRVDGGGSGDGLIIDRNSPTAPTGPGGSSPGTGLAGGSGTSGGTNTTDAADRGGGTGTAPAPAPASPGQPSDPGRDADGSGGAGTPTGPGVSDTTIKIGMTYDRNAGAANSAFGLAGIGQVDQKRAQELLVKYVNDHGGVAGRKLEIVWHVTDQLSGKTPEQRGQEACTTWTQDNQIFAAIGALSRDTQNACLTEAGVVQVGSGAGLSFSETFRRFPYVVDVGEPALDSMARFAVRSLAAQGFYDEARPVALGNPIKVGLLAYDDPVFKAAAAALEAALADHGITLSKKKFITRGKTPDQQVGPEVNQIRAAALEFKEEGITHVQFLMTNNAFGQLMFFQNADNLQYQPRYGLTTIDAAQALIATFESSNPGGPRRQFEMAVGVGWGPLRDVPREDYTGDAESPELRRCKRITEPASDGGFDDAARNKELLVSLNCDEIFYFQAAMNAGGPTPTVDSWLRGVAMISNMGSAATFLLRTDRQRDAVGATRNFAYFPDCNCFHYTSNPTRL